MGKRSKRRGRNDAPPPRGAEALSPADLALEGRMLSLAQALLIVAVGFWVAAPALHGTWIRDDTFYLDPARLGEPAHFWKIWFAPGSFIEYYPLTETVQWLQWQLWGARPFGYHLTNIVLHVANALLVWQLLRKFQLGWAWLGGLLFAVHPAQVESVAWISELKNTLSLAPFLGAMIVWIDYDRHRRPRDFWLALGLFLVAMLAKITMAPFPLVILLYAWWRHGRIGARDFAAAAPFFAVSLVLGALNLHAGDVYAQAHRFGSIETEQGDFLSRVALTGTSLAFYFSKAFWPGACLPMYPRWPIEPLTFPEFLPWPVAAAVIWLLWTRRKTWGRHALLGGFFFLVFILPFLGFTIVSYMRFTWVMDHFLYIPLIGLIGLAVAAIGDIAARLPRSYRVVVTGGVTLAVTLLAFQARACSGAYVNEVTLWTYTLEFNPGAWGARAGLADALAQAGKFDEAIAQYEIIEAQRPGDPEIPNNLGLVLARAGRLPEAQAQIGQALRLKPDYANAHNSLGVVYQRMGRLADAKAEWETALRIDPTNAQARENLAQLGAPPPGDK